MNQKIIKQIVRGKLKAWINSITDVNLRLMVEKNLILTGGSIASLLMNDKPKDYDVYFKDKETTKRVANYYVDLFNKEFESGAEVLDGADAVRNPNNFAYRNLTDDRIKIFISSAGVASSNPDLLNNPMDDVVEVITAIDDANQNKEPKPEPNTFLPVFLSSNAITLTDGVQIVVRFYGQPEEIHKNYDFEHCINWYDYKENKLVLQQKALECILAKELKYQGSRYPLCSIIRTRKFLKRGWHINAGQYLKMIFQLNEMDLKDIDVLEDQLIGVDSAYFMQIIQILRNKKEEDPNFTIDSSYLTTIIDRLF